MTAERSINELLAENLALRDELGQTRRERNAYHHAANEYDALLEKARANIKALEATRDELRHCLLREAIHLSPIAERIQ